MSFCRSFPRILSVCFVLSLLALSARAQQASTRPRLTIQAPQATTTTQTDGRKRLENDLSVAPQGQDEEDDAGAPAESTVEGFAVPSHMGRVERLMLTAIEERL